MRIVVGLSFLTLASAIACSGSSAPPGFGGGGTGSGSGGTGSGSGSGSGGSSSGGINLGGNVGDSGTSGTTIDGGFVCSPNPLNYDIPSNGCDDDGDGKVDNRITCDTGSGATALQAAGSAADFAAAIELCQVADATHWGVVSAIYTDGHTSTVAGKNNFDQQHGVLQTFGNTIKPQDGSAFGVLSSGSATVLDSDSVGGLGGGGTKGAFKGNKNGMQNPAGGAPPFGTNSGDAPPGYPKATPAGCDDGLAPGVNDVINVKLQIKVPANAKGVSFDFDFWSGEWPEWVCSDYNDSFIAYLTSKGFPASPDNISFDSKGNPVSVNNGFFGVCTPGIATGCNGSGSASTSVCSAGIGDLAGTGFADPGTYCTDPSSGGGATGWLTSTAPVQAGETITLEFMIWDKGDWNYDSSVLVDNFSWQPQATSTPITVVAPPPK